MAPVNPAATRNDVTVKPSDMPITMSRTVSPAVKCLSTCRVCGSWVSVFRKPARKARAGFVKLPSLTVGLLNLFAQRESKWIKLKFSDQDQCPDDDKRRAGHAFDPIERQILAEHSAHDHSDRRNCDQGQAKRLITNCPGPLLCAAIVIAAI